MLQASRRLTLVHKTNWTNIIVIYRALQGLVQRLADEIPLGLQRLADGILTASGEYKRTGMHEQQGRPTLGPHGSSTPPHTVLHAHAHVRFRQVIRGFQNQMSPPVSENVQTYFSSVRARSRAESSAPSNSGFHARTYPRSRSLCIDS